MRAEQRSRQLSARLRVAHGQLEDEIEQHRVVLEDLVQQRALRRVDQTHDDELGSEGAAVAQRERLRHRADDAPAQRGHGVVGAVHQLREELRVLEEEEERVQPLEDGEGRDVGKEERATSPFHHASAL